jgi:hypothetical protein
MVKFISFNSGKFSFEFVNDEFVGLVLIIVIKDWDMQTTTLVLISEMFLLVRTRYNVYITISTCALIQ